MMESYAFEVAGHGIFNIGQGLLARGSLTHATGKRRTFGNIDAIFILFENDAVSHMSRPSTTQVLL
jgi:hypothetical protein